MLLVTHNVHKVFLSAYTANSCACKHCADWIKYFQNMNVARESQWPSDLKMSGQTHHSIQKDSKWWFYVVLFSFPYVRLLWLNLHFWKDPLIFLLYINDLLKVMNYPNSRVSSKTILFAEDASIIVSNQANTTVY